MLAAVLERAVQKFSSPRFDDWERWIEVEVESAGYLKEAAGQPAAKEWMELRGETGIDLSSHRSRWMGEIVPDQFDLIICASQDVVDFLVDTWRIPTTNMILANAPDGIPNPWQQGVEAYKQCYSKICEIVSDDLIQIIADRL